MPQGFISGHGRRPRLLSREHPREPVGRLDESGRRLINLRRFLADFHELREHPLGAYLIPVPQKKILTPLCCQPV